jgi:hypothetical protein
MLRRVTVVASASGTRIDCDRCGWHATSPDLPLIALRRATGFARVGDADLCPDCVAETAPAHSAAWQRALQPAPMA